MSRDFLYRVGPLAALLLVALVVRGSVLIGMFANLQQDPDAYREIAENILQHGVYGLGHDDEPRPTAYRPPLYPILLTKIAVGSLHVASLNVALLHLALGVATVWLTYSVARRMLGCHVHGSAWACEPRPSHQPGESPDTPTQSSGRGTQSVIQLGALGAALLVACDPILLNQSALVMTETLAASLTVLSLYALLRFDAARTPWNAGLAGGAIGLAILSRPTFLPWLGLVALIPLVLKTRWPLRFANCAAMLAVAAIVLTPWTVRNYQLFGKPIATTTHGGYTLLLGNNEMFYEHLTTDTSGLPWSSAELDAKLQDARNNVVPPGYFQLRPWTELSIDHSCYFHALRQINENRFAFVRACLFRIRQLWSPLPHKLTADESPARRGLRYATAAWYVMVYLLAATGVYQLRGRLLRTPWVYGLLLCLVLTAVHTFYWSNLRMRAPLMPFVALVAGVGLTAVLPRGCKSLQDKQLH